MDYEVRDAQPTINGLIVRSVDAVGGRFKDLDVRDGRHRVLVEFPHERVDTYKTTFGRECFRRSFAERHPVMVWQHDLKDPIGRAENAQVLRNCNELTGVFSDFEKVPQAARAHSQIEDGTLTDFSFGFRDPVYERHPEHRGVRRISEATMKEFSPVTIGSIPGAVATGIREEDVMSQQSVQDIIALRDAHMISEEAAAHMIREMVDPSLAEHIKILTPSSDTTTREPEPEAPHEVECENCQARSMSDVPFCARCGTQLVTESRDDELPETIGPAEVFAALPENYQRAIAEAEARVFLVVGEEEWGPIDGQTRAAVDEHAVELLAKVDAACRAGFEWLEEVDLEALSTETRQAIDLYKAAGVGAAALMETLGVRADAEDMASHPVKCELCGGSGETEDGKVCPQCGGSGIEAVERADGDMVECPRCDGKGKLPAPKAGGHQLTCPVCHGKGKVSESVAEENRAEEPPDGLRFVSAEDRKKMAKEGIAMDNGDFPIPDKDHLQSALGHWSTYTGDKGKAKAHIEKRAKALGVSLSDDAFDGSRAAPDDDDDSEDDMVDESGDGKPSGTGAAASEDEKDDDEDDRASAALRRLERRSRRPAKV